MTAQPIDNPAGKRADALKGGCWPSCVTDVWGYNLQLFPYFHPIPAHDSALLRQDLGGVGASTDGQVTSHAQRMDVERNDEQRTDG